MMNDESFIILPGADFFLQISKNRRVSCSLLTAKRTKM